MEQNRKVKSMKKKISLIFCLCLMVLGLAACGDPTQQDYFGMTYEELQSTMEQEVTALVALDDQGRIYLQTYGNNVAMRLIETWDEATGDLGAFQGFGEFAVTKAQDTLTVEQNVNYPGRQVVVTYVYTYNYATGMAELTDASVDKVYTMGEKMSKAGLNTLMGMGTVFSVLILISLLIYCFRFIPNGQNRDVPERIAAPEAVSAPSSAVPEQLTDDLELVAVISAAIAASTGTSTDNFVVRSIRRR